MILSFENGSILFPITPMYTPGFKTIKLTSCSDFVLKYLIGQRQIHTRNWPIRSLILSRKKEFYRFGTHSWTFKKTQTVWNAAIYEMYEFWRQSTYLFIYAFVSCKSKYSMTGSVEPQRQFNVHEEYTVSNVTNYI